MAIDGILTQEEQEEVDRRLREELNKMGGATQLEWSIMRAAHIHNVLAERSKETPPFDGILTPEETVEVQRRFIAELERTGGATQVEKVVMRVVLIREVLAEREKETPPFDGAALYQRIKKEQRGLYLWEQPLRDTLRVFLEAIEPLYRPASESEPAPDTTDLDQLAHECARLTVEWLGTWKIGSGGQQYKIDLYKRVQDAAARYERATKQ